LNLRLLGPEAREVVPSGIQGRESTVGDGVVSVPESASQTPVCNELCNAIDADEEVLEAKMLAADLEGNRTLVGAYQRRLERLRAGKAAGNVVDLAAERRRR
jgi:hypothetical protein